MFLFDSDLGGFSSTASPIRVYQAIAFHRTVLVDRLMTHGNRWPSVYWTNPWT